MVARRAYHKEHEHGPFCGTEFFCSPQKIKREKVVPGDVLYVASGKRGPDFAGSGVQYYFEGVFRVVDLSPGVSNPRHLPQGRNQRLHLQPVNVPPAAVRLDDRDDFDRRSFNDEIANQFNLRELPIDWKQWFDRLLSPPVDEMGLALLEDLRAIDDSGISKTEKETLIQARLGQGTFRDRVIETWSIGECCALTGVRVPQLLTASHIKPWREANDRERLDGANGVLLCAHVDRLFDRHMLSFRRAGSDYKCVIALPLAGLVERLGVHEGAALSVARMRPSDFGRFSEYMEEHFQRFQEMHS